MDKAGLKASTGALKVPRSRRTTAPKVVEKERAKILSYSQIQSDNLVMVNQAERWWKSRGSRGDIAVQSKKHGEEGTRETREIPRAERQARKGVEGENNSGRCGDRNT